MRGDRPWSQIHLDRGKSTRSPGRAARNETFPLFSDLGLAPTGILLHSGRFALAGDERRRARPTGRTRQWLPDAPTLPRGDDAPDATTGRGGSDA